MWICQVWRFVGMLYIKIDPSDRETHCNTSYHKIDVSGAHRPLKRGLRPHGGPLKCEFVKFDGLLACYTSKSIPVIDKLIATHFIIRLMCQGRPRPLKRGLSAPGSPWNVNLSSLRFVGMLYIKINPSDRETHCSTSYHKIGMSGPPRALKRGLRAGVNILLRNKELV